MRRARAIAGGRREGRGAAARGLSFVRGGDVLGVRVGLGAGESRKWRAQLMRGVRGSRGGGVRRRGKDVHAGEDAQKTGMVIVALKVGGEGMLDVSERECTRGDSGFARSGWEQ